jgi:hypothetical protein
MEVNAVASSGAYGVQKEMPRIGTLLPVPYGIGTIPDPDQWQCDSVQEVIDLCRAITEMTEGHEDLGIEYEWNTVDGWDYLSTEEEVISDFCELYHGESVEENEVLHDVFYEAVLHEYRTRPRNYSNYSLDDLVSYWRSKYTVGDRHFVLDSLSTAVEPRVKTTEEE